VGRDLSKNQNIIKLFTCKSNWKSRQKWKISKHWTKNWGSSYDQK